MPEDDKGVIGKRGNPLEQRAGKGRVGKRKIANIGIVIKIGALSHLAAGEPVNLQIQRHAPDEGIGAVVFAIAGDAENKEGNQKGGQSRQSVEFFHG